jgi:hypothetical protein
MERFPEDRIDDGGARSPGEQHRALLAAMFAVYASSELKDTRGRWLPSAARPMSVPEALSVIKDTRGPLHDRAYRVCAARMAVSALRDGRSDMRRSLVDLVGRETARRILDVKGRVTPDDITELVYQTLDGGGREGLVPLPRETGTAPGTSLDIATMTTTVSVSAPYEGSFEELAVKLDPRSWTSSPFWLAATKVILVDGRFVPDPREPPLGTSWSGYFYE